MTETKTRAQQRIEQLINIGRPLTDPESDELYRALHADYMRQWRAQRAKAIARAAGWFLNEQARDQEKKLLARVREEARV